VNDAFGAAHRAHASTVGVAEVIRGRGGLALAGRLMTRELHFLKTVLDSPPRPFVAVLGGAKIEGKVDVIERLLPRVDCLLIGGAIATTFLVAEGYPIGRSLVDLSRVEMAARFLATGRETINLPSSFLVTNRLSNDAESRVAIAGGIGSGEMIVDISPTTAQHFAAVIRGARTTIMNGPLGVMDFPAFTRGTDTVLRAMASVADTGGLAVLGGGDSAAAANAAGIARRFTHVSTGGGASLALLGGQRLPAVDALGGPV